jgi:hypothetical protein
VFGKHPERIKMKAIEMNDARRRYLETVVNAPSDDDDIRGDFEEVLKFDDKIRDALGRSDWTGIAWLLDSDEGFPARYPNEAAGWPEELG